MKSIDRRIDVIGVFDIEFQMKSSLGEINNLYCGFF